MTITPAQVADLQPGDVVRVTYEGAVSGNERAMYIEGRKALMFDGKPAAWMDGCTLTVVSRAPRPLYVNHPRTEPAPGDVVRIECADAADDSYTNAYLPRSAVDELPWISLTHDPGQRYRTSEAMPDGLDGWSARLLVDGETGMTVPS